MAHISPPRLFYLDNIKLAAIIHIMFCHIMNGYILKTKFINENELIHSDLFQYIDFETKSFIMSLLFFVSGFLFFKCRQGKNAKDILKKRISRYGVPIVVSQLIMYVFLDGGIPVTWYLEVLLLFIFLTLLLESILGNRLHLKITLKFQVKNLFAIGVIMGVMTHFVRIKFPMYYYFSIPCFHIEVGDSVKFAFHWMLGMIAYKNNWFDNLTISNLRCLFIGTAAIVSTGFLYYLGIITRYSSIYDSLNCLFISMLLVSLFRLYCDRTNKVITWMSQQSMGVYICHCFYIIIILCALKNIDLPVSFKWAILFILTYSISFGVTYLLRKVPFMARYL